MFKPNSKKKDSSFTIKNYFMKLPFLFYDDDQQQNLQIQQFSRMISDKINRDEITELNQSPSWPETEQLSWCEPDPSLSSTDIFSSSISNSSEIFSNTDDCSSDCACNSLNHDPKFDHEFESSDSCPLDNFDIFNRHYADLEDSDEILNNSDDLNCSLGDLLPDVCDQINRLSIHNSRKLDCDTQLPIFMLNEIQEHDSFDDCWIILYDKVYDITRFLQEHPGGEDVLLEHAGRDATVAFRSVGHTAMAVKALEQYLVGILPDNQRLFPSDCETRWSIM